MSLKHFVCCDKCELCSVTQPSYEIRGHSMREQLKEMGWRVGQKGGQDYCPECARKMTFEKRVFVRTESRGASG